MKKRSKYLDAAQRVLHLEHELAALRTFQTALFSAFESYDDYKAIADRRSKAPPAAAARPHHQGPRFVPLEVLRLERTLAYFTSAGAWSAHELSKHLGRNVGWDVAVLRKSGALVVHSGKARGTRYAARGARRTRVNA
jgi:hypothetical protein